MINKENRSQLDKIAEILGCDFGIADLEGRVHYSGSSNVKEGDIIGVPEVSAEAGAEYEFAEIGGMCFLLYKIENDSAAWFFLSADGEESESKRRLLELALCAYDNRREFRKRRKTEFFRSLMSGGYSSVDINDFNTYATELKADALGYTVIIVSQAQGSGMYEETNLSVLEEFLSGMFPSREGYCVIPGDADRMCIICPITEEAPLEVLLENANLISDTVLSELMINVTVSVGAVVSAVKSIDTAFKTAERAETISRIFELEGKSFAYDKLGLARLVYGLSKETCIAFLKETLGTQILEDKGWYVKPNGQEDEIKKTIKTFLETNQNISETSRALYIHRNTLVYRLDKFNKMTGLDCTKFEDGMKVGMALLVLQYLSKIK